MEDLSEVSMKSMLTFLGHKRLEDDSLTQTSVLFQTLITLYAVNLEPKLISINGN